jgi:LmbE family N-acetylglucosaminyl deacetylase
MLPFAVTGEARPSCRALFVQPHLDDVALSCGGTVRARAAASADPHVVTVFAAPPPPGVPLGRLARFMHMKWRSDAPAEMRLREDDAAVAILGATPIRLAFLDAVYRGGYDARGALLSGEPIARDEPLAERVADELEAIWHSTARATLYMPLGIGRHVDHVVCANAARRLHDRGLNVVLYEDVPYALTPGAREARLAAQPAELAEIVDVSAFLDARIAAIAAYRSQLDLVFEPDVDPAEAVARFARGVGEGTATERFWRFPERTA